MSGSGKQSSTNASARVRKKAAKLAIHRRDKKRAEREAWKEQEETHKEGEEEKKETSD